MFWLKVEHGHKDEHGENNEHGEHGEHGSNDSYPDESNECNLVEVEHGSLGFLLKRLQPTFHSTVVQVDVLQYLNLSGKVGSSSFLSKHYL